MACFKQSRFFFITVYAVLVSAGVAHAADEIHWTFTGQTSITLDWRGSTAEDYVQYGTSPGAYTETAIAQTPTPLPFSSPSPFWEAKLTGLAEDTLYYYSVAGGPEHSFRTPPPRGASGFSLFAEGDIGDSGSYGNMPLVQSLIADGSPNFVLVLGDITYGNDHGQDAVDQHFIDVETWSLDTAYMPAWGNHEWDVPKKDDLRNYKGRFDFPNPQTSSNAPSEGCCGEDWYWFDYGNVRFISYPEPWTWSVNWTEWAPQADILMAEAEADPDIDFIVTFGHRPAYSSGRHPGEDSLRSVLDGLGASYSKYVLNLNGHSHEYERTYPQDGVVHITVGTGGSTVGGDDESCRWSVCPPPSWSAYRAVRNGALRLSFSTAADGKANIDGEFICGPASDRDDVSCTMGDVLDSFNFGPNLPPESAIDSPVADLSIAVGSAVYFDGWGDDPDGDLPLSFFWDFDGGAPDQSVEDPGNVTFNSKGVYTVTLQVTDSLGRADPTPDSRVITVTGPEGTITAESFTASKFDDAEEYESGYILMSSTDLELVYDGSNQTVGMRFGGLAVPRGSTIVDAYIQFKTDETTSVDTTLRIQGEAVDDAVAFDWTDFGISTRPKTTADVWWSPPPWLTVGEQGPDQRTPNIAPVIQEITDRLGWIEGNALVLIISGVGERVAEAYDGDPTGSPALYVEYLPPVSGNTAPVVTITAPSSDPNAMVGDVIGFAGGATDAEDNDTALTATMTWTSNLQAGTLGTGGSFSTNALVAGVHTITASVTDSGGLSDSATVTVTVNESNAAPVAADGGAATDEDTAVTVNVLSLASDPDPGDLVSLQSCNKTGQGSVALSAGACVYDPNGQFESLAQGDAGSDNFTYTVTDGIATDTGTITVAVTGVNDAPMATDDSAATDKDTAIAIAVLEGDSDVDNGATLSVTDCDGSSSVGLVTRTGNLCSFDPNGNFDTLPEGESTTDTFTYTITDGFDTATAMVTVTVTNPVVATTYGVSDLITSSFGVRNTWTAEVTPVVTDNSGAAVAGVTVIGYWDNEPANAEACTTGISGQCTNPITQSGIHKSAKSRTFIVDAASGGSLTWDGVRPSVTVSRH